MTDKLVLRKLRSAISFDYKYPDSLLPIASILVRVAKPPIISFVLKKKYGQLVVYKYMEKSARPSFVE